MPNLNRKTLHRVLEKDRKTSSSGDTAKQLTLEQVQLFVKSKYVRSLSEQKHEG